MEPAVPPSAVRMRNVPWRKVFRAKIAPRHRRSKQRVDRIAQKQRQRGLVTRLDHDTAGKRAVQVALGCFGLELEQTLRRLGRARMLVLQLRQRIAAGLQIVLEASDFGAGFVGLAEFFLRLAARLLRLFQCFVFFEEKRLRLGEPGACWSTAPALRRGAARARSAPISAPRSAIENSAAGVRARRVPAPAAGAGVPGRAFPPRLRPARPRRCRFVR